MQATIWYSPDAASWERIPLGPAGRGTAPGNSMDIRIEAVTWDGQRFVAVGTDRSDLNGRNLGEAKARAAVWTSTDGRSWDRVPHTADLDVGGFVDTLEDPAIGRDVRCRRRTRWARQRLARCATRRRRAANRRLGHRPTEPPGNACRRCQTRLASWVRFAASSAALPSRWHGGLRRVPGARIHVVRRSELGAARRSMVATTSHDCRRHRRHAARHRG